MNKLYRSLTLAAVIVSVVSSAEAGMISRGVSAFRSVLGYDKRPTPVPTQAVEIPVRAEKVKVNLDYVVTERSDNSVDGRKIIGVRLTPASTIGRSSVLDLPEDGPDEYDRRIADPTGGGATGRNDRAGLVAIPGRPTEASAGIGLQTYVLTERPTADAKLKGDRPAVRNIHDDMTGGGTGIGTRDGAASRGVSAGVLASRGKNGEGISRRDGSRVGPGSHITTHGAGPGIVPQGARLTPWLRITLGVKHAQYKYTKDEDTAVNQTVETKKWVWWDKLPRRRDNGVGSGHGCIDEARITNVTKCIEEQQKIFGQHVMIASADDDLTNVLLRNGTNFGTYNPNDKSLNIHFDDAVAREPCTKVNQHQESTLSTGISGRKHGSTEKEGGSMPGCNPSPRRKHGLTFRYNEGDVSLKLNENTQEGLGLMKGQIDLSGYPHVLEESGTGWQVWRIDLPDGDCPEEKPECHISVTALVEPSIGDVKSIAYAVIWLGDKSDTMAIPQCGTVPYCFHDNGGITPDFNRVCAPSGDDRTFEEVMQNCTALTGRPPLKNGFPPTSMFEASQLSNATEDMHPTRLLNATEDMDPTQLFNATEDMYPSLLFNATEDMYHSQLFNATEGMDPTPLFNATEDMDPTQLFNATEDIDPTQLVNATDELWQTVARRTNYPVATMILQPTSSHRTSRLFGGSPEMTLTSDFSASRSHHANPSEMDEMPASKMNPYNIAAAAVGAAIVTTAGVVVGYLVFKKYRGHGSSSDGVRLEIIATQ
jgi:hypothetical protein